MDSTNIKKYVKELEEKVQRYEEVLEVFARPANAAVLKGNVVQKWADTVYTQKKRLTNWDLELGEEVNDLNETENDFEASGC